ncbi:MAG: FAD-binding oxidoreductase [Rhodothermales bacterium]|nr:FAD-binding oxidoreductase [Rhodothermales bacterium]MBO6781264.1 FAD-binding oxidoreductase [Rhodothermales bacterium]
MTRSVWHTASPARLEADVCIVGAGILGCSTAFWLRRVAPALRVTVLDARWPAWGASGRNAGFLLQGAVTDYVTDIELYGLDRARRLRRFTHENRDRLLDEIPGAAFRFVPSGSLTVAGDGAEEERLRRSAGRMREDGFAGSFLESDALNARIGSVGFLGGLFTETGGMLDPFELVNQLVARSGALVRRNHRAVAVHQGRVVGDGFEVRADQIVIAAGPWAPDLWPAAAAWVEPHRAQMLALKPRVPARIPAPVYSHEGYYYLRSDYDGRVLVGGARHRHRTEEAGFLEGTSVKLQADLEAYAHAHFPSLAGAEVVRRWSGIMGFSPDGLPVVGPVGDGIWMATGFTGHGMAYGFRAGQLLARGLTGAVDEAGDLFAPDRPELTAHAASA